MSVSFFVSQVGKGVVTCMAADTKPVVPDGMILIEEDTGKVFRRESSAWLEKLNDSYTGGPGGSATVGQATIPFASFLTEDSVVVTGQSALTTNSRITATIYADNEDVVFQGWLPPMVSAVVAGVGFTVGIRPDFGNFKGPVKINWGYQ